MTAELLSSDDVIVALDHGQFSLETRSTEPDLATELLDVAIRDGIAQRDGLIVALSPHQNSLAMPVRIEVWSGAPEDDLLDWQEAFEVHLDISEHGLIYGSPTMDYVRLAVPPGSYLALITGRGFVGHGWPGSTQPGDSWRLRLWPSDVVSTPRRLKAFDDGEDTDERTPSEHEPAGRAASERIRDDLNRAPGARDLSSPQGTVRVEHIFPFARAKVWDHLIKPQSWVTWRGDFDIDPVPGGRYLIEHDHVVPERACDEWILGSTFDVLGQWVDLQRPASGIYTWTWREPPAERNSADFDNHDQWLDWRWNRPTRLGPTTVQVHLAIHRVEGTRYTRAVITHNGIPSAWVDDLHAWWAWQLEHCERIIRIN